MKHSEITPDYTAIKQLGLPGWARSLPLAGSSGDHEKSAQKNIRVLIVLNVVSIALALLLFAGLILSWSINSDLNTVRRELAELQQFEKRILAGVDTMNNGIQHRLSKVDRRMGVIQSDISLVTKGRRDPAAAVERIATMVRNDGAYFGTATAELLLAPELSGQTTRGFVPSQSAKPPSFARTYSGADPSQGEASLFRRVTTEDGKVRYEMRR
ncbi:hypothetical protein [Roseibium sediminicola]|uniref:Type IV pilus assembly protein PilN n=1 Tax=Roseibium sediminicola TaxID=2933272 RepID=A0ABT0GYI9_9HYPH|nr:hypothetical protein [Roseibium sp. CAU 1639]MCK7614498.1 hypothetical protein [Roseibium sp. CAU 1639]